MEYTVKQLSELAGVSKRTLHYYDEIGLLKPSYTRPNGYRCYRDPELLKLQQILFFRELDFPLEQIKKIVNSPDFDMLSALSDQRKMLELESDRLGGLIKAIEKTIDELKGEIKMSDDEIYEAFSNEQVEEYRQEVIDRWGEDTLLESEKRVKSWSREDRKRIEEEGKDILMRIVELMDKGPGDASVQEQVKRYYGYISNYSDYTPEVFKELGKMYAEDKRFAAYYQEFHQELPEFMRDAIAYYVDNPA